jgi:hypothetical protein
MPDPQADLRTPWQKAQGPYIRLRRWWRWRQQGSPRDFPVVVKIGQLIRWPDGEKVVTGWGFDPWRMTATIDAEQLWDGLAERYPRALVGGGADTKDPDA